MNKKNVRVKIKNHNIYVNLIFTWMVLTYKYKTKRTSASTARPIVRDTMTLILVGCLLLTLLQIVRFSFSFWKLIVVIVLNSVKIKRKCRKSHPNYKCIRLIKVSKRFKKYIQQEIITWMKKALNWKGLNITFV